MWRGSRRLDGNGGGQIQCNVAATARIAKEGSQRSGHELRSLQIETLHLALDKFHDIVGTQSRERDRFIAKPIIKEIENERQVVGDGCSGEGARFAQIFHVGLCMALN
jgi:hypothetical protein